MNRQRVLAFGEILYDVIEGKPYLGGAPLNFAYYVRQFGIPVGVISAVGRDELGLSALKAVKRAGIEASMVTKNEKPTGYVTVKLDKGQPSFIIHKNVAWDYISAPKLKGAPDLLYFGSLAQRSSYNRASLKRLLALKPEQVFFDVNLRQKFYSRSILLAGFRAATILKFNDAEWLVIKKLFRLDTPRDIIRKFRPWVVIMTKGEKGAELFTSTEHFTAKGPKVTVKDAVGAGDAFSAAFAASTLKGVYADEALKLACKVGAFVVTRAGAQNKLPASLKKF